MELSLKIEDWLRIKRFRGGHPLSRERFFVRVGDSGFLATRQDNGSVKVRKLTKDVTYRYEQACENPIRTK